MDTIDTKGAAGRRRRRIHSDEFKADAVAAASLPGVSMAAVALDRGINANLLRRWVYEAEGVPVQKSAAVAATPAAAPAAPAFVPVRLPDPVPPAAEEIRVELRRGATTITVAWPVGAASECAAWMRELLR